ncbi:MAG: MFS transporter [Gammaproteobacteria bacterium]
MRDPATSALSSKNYRTYLYGSIFSLLGVWIQRLAIGWHAWQLSESAFVVGLVAAVQFLPVIFLTPFFGVLVDRIRAQTGAIVANIIMGMIAAIMGVVTLQGGMTAEILLSLALAQGFVVSFYSPARLALLPDLVSKQRFQSSVAIQATVFNLSRFVGPALAGFVIAFWGIGWSYVINAITYIPAVLSIALLKIDHSAKPPRNKKPYVEELKEGLKYAGKHPQIRMAILMSLAASFFGRSILDLLPAFVAIMFQGGSNGLAALMAAAGLGALVGSVAMTTEFLRVRLQFLIVGGCFCVAIALVAFGLAANLYIGLAAIALLGLSCTFVSVGSQTLVQLRVEDRLRGRVISLWSLVIMGGPALGGIAGGWFVGSIGPLFTALASATGCLLFAVLIARWNMKA